MPLQHGKLPTVQQQAGGLEPADVLTLQDAIEIPKALQDAALTNPVLAASLLPTVTAAVKRSLEQSDTRMRALTGNELKRRAQICLEALQVLYCEQNLSLHQCYHALERVLRDALLMDVSMADRAAETERAGFYKSSTDESPGLLMETEGEDLAPPPEPIPSAAQAAALALAHEE